MVGSSVVVSARKSSNAKISSSLCTGSNVFSSGGGVGVGSLIVSVVCDAIGVGSGFGFVSSGL